MTARNHRVQSLNLVLQVVLVMLLSKKKEEEEEEEKEEGHHLSVGLINKTMI